MHDLTDASGAVVATADAPWTWDAGNQGWRSSGHLVMDPGRAYAAAAAMEMDALDFLLLFTIDEHAAIKESNNSKVRVFYSMVTDGRRKTVGLSHPMTVAGVHLVESLGLIASGRAAQVLAGQPPA